MDKQSIKNILKIKREQTKQLILSKIKTTESIIIDEVTTEIWWIVNKWKLLEFEKYWVKWKVIDEEVKLECRKLWVRLINLLSSTSNWAIENYLERKLNNKWVAFEYFMREAIERNKNDNEDNQIKVEWVPLEFDSKKIDFLGIKKIRKKVIRFWIQLTTTQSAKINSKERDVEHAKNEIDRESSLFNNKSFYPTKTPDLPVLFVVNSIISERLNTNDWINIFREAYISWEKDWFKELSPISYLDKDIKDELNMIWKLYHEMTNIFIGFMQSNEDLERPQKRSIFNKEWEFDIEYNSERNYCTINFSKKNENDKEFVFSQSFKITNKFLRKLGINRIIGENENEAPKKKRKRSKKYNNWRFNRRK